MKNIIFGALISVISVTVNAATFNVVSGTFEVDNFGAVPLTGNGSFTENTFTGSAAGISSDPSATYAGFDTALYLGSDLEFYFLANGTAGNPGPFSGPSIDFGTMTADMSSMFTNWNSFPGFIQEFNVGGVASVTAVGSNLWELTWSSLQVGGPYPDSTISMSMTVSAVPVPAAVWLFGSGLLALVGFARRK